MKSDVPPMAVLLAYIADWQTFAMVPRLLRRAGFIPVAFGPSGSLVARSRYTERAIGTGKAAIDVLAQLKDHLTNEGKDRYTRVIFCEDPILRAIHRSHGSEWLPWLPVRSWSTFDIIMSKALLISAGEKAGLCVPRTRLCGEAEALRQTALDFGFPLFVKPDVGTGGQFAFRIDHAGELEKRLSDGLPRYPVIAQEFISGNVGCTSVVFANGRPLSMLHSFKYRSHPGPYGPSTARVFCDCPGAETLVRGIGALTGFDGLAGIDWIADHQTGEIKLLEMNPRPVSCVHLGRYGGQDSAMAIRDWLEGRHHEQRMQVKIRTPVLLFPKDVIRCLHLDLRELRHWVSPFVCRDIPWADPPVLAQLTRQMTGEGVRALTNKVRGTLAGWRKG